MAQSKRIRRLLLCSICFEEDCPLSRWVEEDEPDGELIQLLDEIQQLWLLQQHEQIELFEASREAKEAVIDKVQAIADSTGDTIEVQTLIDGEVQKYEYTPTFIEKDDFLDSILHKNAEHLENKPKDKQQNH
jgi:hypothetical protein